MNARAECKNCGAELSGAYCSACGQTADTNVPSLWGLLVDAFCDLYDFDSRVWRSLGLLAFKPGALTREFLAGRRARYVPPFRLYLTLSVVFFVLASLPDGDEAAGADEAAPAADEAAAGADEDATAARQRTPDTGPAALAEEEIFAGNGSAGWSCDFAEISNLPPALRERFEEGCRQMSVDNGASFGRAFLDNVPLMMFLFIPLVAGVMKALYPFARRKYVEHLLFLLHFHALFFLIGSLQLGLGRLTSGVPVLGSAVGWALFAAWIYFPVYLFLAMRRVYEQGRLLTMSKYLLLGVGYFMTLLLTLIAVLAYTVLTL